MKISSGFGSGEPGFTNLVIFCGVALTTPSSFFMVQILPREHD
jgi:hypothetical protein